MAQIITAERLVIRSQLARVDRKEMAFKSGFVVQGLVLLSLVALLTSALTITDNQGRQFEQREIVVPTGISQDQLNVEIQKAIRELYPSYRNKPELVVKELSSFDELNKSGKA